MATIANQRARLAAVELELDLPRDTRIVRINILRCDLDDCVAALYDPTEARLVTRAVGKVLDRELVALVRQCQHESDEHHERSTVADRVVAIQTLSTGFAHELRNPLNSARLQLELLERRLHPADSRVTESLTAIDHELERLSRLLKEFLAFAHPSELAVADSDLGELVGVVLTAERSFAESRGVRLVGPEPGCFVARVDVGKVTQVMQNLVRNAIEASNPGGHVGITLRGDREYVHLDVEDDGPGIPEAIRRRIYEPFFTTKDSGTGLGLSIAHRVMRLHGGRIELHSNDNGTRFELVLPRQPRSAAEADAHGGGRWRAS
jgi:signal transduction histidine kinase